MKKWWGDNSCNTRPTCTLYGCTCQGMSDKYGTDHILGQWGSVDQQPQAAYMKKWWGDNSCNTRPTCTLYGCTCQGMSDKYGTDHILGQWGSVEQQPQAASMKKWWGDNSCNTRPTCIVDTSKWCYHAGATKTMEDC